MGYVVRSWRVLVLGSGHGQPFALIRAESSTSSLRLLLSSSSSSRPIFLISIKTCQKFLAPPEIPSNYAISEQTTPSRFETNPAEIPNSEIVGERRGEILAEFGELVDYPPPPSLECESDAY